MAKKIYAITNVDEYAKEMRYAAAQSLSENNEDDLDEYISIGQVKNLITSNCLGFDNSDRPLMNEKINESIYEQVAVWIHNVGLAKLAAQGLIECAWDNECDEMVFWQATSK